MIEGSERNQGDVQVLLLGHCSEVVSKVCLWKDSQELGNTMAFCNMTETHSGIFIKIMNCI